MDTKNIPLDKLRPAPWNPNVMSGELQAKLRRSVEEFGTVENLVVRSDGDGYEVLSGNQRLRVYQELRLASIPCVVVSLPDAQARLLAQVLNRTRGEDDFGLKASLIRQLRETLDPSELTKYLPDSEKELAVLLTVGETSLEQAFARWTERDENPLHTLTFALRPEQLETVTKAIEAAQTLIKGNGAAQGSHRTAALEYVCRKFVDDIGRTRGTY